MNFWHLASKIHRGQSLTRALMDIGLRDYEISGVVVDVGGARNPDYFNYLQKREVKSVSALDSMISGINFEKDSLPLETGAVDTVLLCNVLEHIYNHGFLLREIARILRQEGKLTGFVPFLLGYHRDPHDYFRYTHEALDRMLREAGFSNVRVERVGGGPFFANCNNIILSVPRLIRVPVFALYYVLDRTFIKLSPRSPERYTLGYIFSAQK